MPGRPGGSYHDDAWIPRRFAEIDARLRELAAARSAEATAIGAGGIRSSDFDGTDPTAPGTAGWKIGRVAAGASYLIVNGLSRFAGLVRVVGELIVTGPTTLAGNTAVSGSLGVSGPMSVTGATTVGGTLAVTGDATFSGNLAVPNGSITNAALASPTVGVSGNGSTGGTAVTISTSLADYAGITFTVPAGFTKAEVTAISCLAMSQALTINMRTRINGVDGTVMPVLSSAGGFGNGASAHASSLTGLVGGGTFTVVTRCQASQANTLAVITTSAAVTFYR